MSRDESTAARPSPGDLIRAVLLQSDSSRADEATEQLEQLERELVTLRGFYESTCTDLLEHDKANESVRSTVERIRETANLAQEVLDDAV